MCQGSIVNVLTKIGKPLKLRCKMDSNKCQLLACPSLKYKLHLLYLDQLKSLNKNSRTWDSKVDDTEIRALNF
jgi:hypothetical protein